MTQHRIITFLENEESFKGVDKEFRGLIREFYKIPGCGTHGVSCAGHEEYTLKGLNDEEMFPPRALGAFTNCISPRIVTYPFFDQYY